MTKSVCNRISALSMCDQPAKLDECMSPTALEQAPESPGNVWQPPSIADQPLAHVAKLAMLTSPVNQTALPPDATAYDAYSMGRAPHFAALKRASRTFRCAASRPAIKSGIAVVACLHCAVADLFGDAEAFAQVAGVGAGAVSADGAAQHLA
ncbi:hypothetical protein [Xanthomonas campestris]|uniref:hypothetical protein n=1 Tax=Xanthomonas campestris TaxID=339 RepID=UPI00137B286B|nr:hypothetical protein [Xanthomonas campestris]